MAEANIKRTKRTIDYFDPLYEPSCALEFDLVAGWPAGKDYVRGRLMTRAQLESVFNPEDRVVFYRASFDRCDFEGDFRSYVPAFKFCIFDRCDFGFSKWRRARFQNCEFRRCSFSLAAFEECEFRDCKLSDIGLSGNELILEDTVVTNPGDFIDTGYTNLDVAELQERGTSKEYQIMRLEGTKATVARALMHNLSVVGDEDAYYQSVSKYHMTSSSYRIYRSKYNLSQNPGANVVARELFNLIVFYVERFVISGSGFLNSWGASIGRPTIVGVGILSLYAYIYWLTGARPDFISSVITSLDITLLIGYTKHASATDGLVNQSLFASNMLTGIAWYSVMVPTIISRISRV